MTAKETNLRTGLYHYEVTTAASVDEMEFDEHNRFCGFKDDVLRRCYWYTTLNAAVAGAFTLANGGGVAILFLNFSKEEGDAKNTVMLGYFNKDPKEIGSTIVSNCSPFVALLIMDVHVGSWESMLAPVREYFLGASEVPPKNEN